MFWVAIQSGGQKLIFKFSRKLNAADYSKVLKNYEKLRFPGFFQQGHALAHKSKVIGNCFQEKEWKVLEWAEHSPDVNPIKNMGKFAAASTNTDNFFGKIKI